LTNSNSIRYVLFDLDETMYATETGIMDLISDRINQYMSLRLGIDPEDVAGMRRGYYEQYGTTGRGLFLHHDIDVCDYFHFVHDLPVEDVLEPDPRLDQMLEGLDTEKIIFTNATAAHARRVLRALQVDRHFERIVDIEALGYVPKPDLRAYRHALQLLQVRGEECLLVDDRLRNLRPGRELGMTTVLVGLDRPGDGADFVVGDVVEIGDVVRRLHSGQAGQQ
jgi:putative hydrolase of the HAD superfamily